MPYAVEYELTNCRVVRTFAGLGVKATEGRQRGSTSRVKAEVNNSRSHVRAVAQKLRDSPSSDAQEATASVWYFNQLSLRGDRLILV
jgi:hypothetical protein